MRNQAYYAHDDKEELKGTTTEFFVGPLQERELKCCIYQEVLSAYGSGDITDCKTFDDFWSILDRTNGYEEDWKDNKEKFKPVYEEIYLELKAFL